MPVTVLRTSDGNLDSQDRKALNELQQRLDSGQRKVLLYLHGGLVDQASAEKMATRLSGEGPTALNMPSEWEQVYVLWRTGVYETLKTNWTDIFENDELYRALFKRLVSFVSKKLGSAARATRGTKSHEMFDDEIDLRLDMRRPRPFQSLDILASGTEREGLVSLSDAEIRDELELSLQLDPKLNEVGSNIDAYVAEKTKDHNRAAYTGQVSKGFATFGVVDSSIQNEWAAPGHTGRARALEIGGALIGIVGHGLKIAFRVIGRFRAGRDHGVHATIVEEIAREFYGDKIGSAIWYMMVKDAADHFGKERLGAELLEMFAPYDDLKLVVVGHSAGSIWATDMLLARSAIQSLPPLDLILLAPAVRTSKFNEMLKIAGAQIGRFRVFLMRDELERADALLGAKYGFLYPSSLLYLVSGAFEHTAGQGYTDAPLLGMERFIGGAREWLTEAAEVDALASVRSFLAAQPNRVVLSESQVGPGLNTIAKSHGGFDDDPDTLASILNCIL